MSVIRVQIVPPSRHAEVCRCSPIDLLHIQRQSAYLIGRDRAVVDIPVEHPSCSKQHAVIQCMSLRCTCAHMFPHTSPQTGRCRRRMSLGT